MIDNLRRKLACFLAAGAIFAIGVAVAQAQSAGRYEGILTVIWGHPQPGQPGGAIAFELTLADDTIVPLRVAPALQNEAFTYVGRRVAVQGHTDAALNAAPVIVDSITATDAERQPPAQKQAVAGPVIKRVLYLLLKYKGDNQQTHPPGFYIQLTNPMNAAAAYKIPSTINAYFYKTSWNKVKWAAVVGGNKWFVLPKTKTEYAPCSSFDGSCANANLNLLKADALAIADAHGMNWQSYDQINIVLNNDLDCCAWGGTFSSGGVTRGITWEPPWAQHAETYVHELGHALGLPHSGWRYYAYDSPWDIMSAHSQLNGIVCGSYISINSANANRNLGCYEPGSGYITPYKDFLGWLGPSNKVLIDAPMVKVVNLSAGALPLGVTKKMIKICLPATPCDGNTAHFLTVEARIKDGSATTQFDNGIPGNGVVIHDVQMNRGASGSPPCFFNAQTGWAMPIDATPNDAGGHCSSFQAGWPNYALGNAQFGVNQIYKDVANGITIKVLAAITNGYQVRVVRSK